MGLPRNTTDIAQIVSQRKIKPRFFLTRKASKKLNALYGQMRRGGRRMRGFKPILVTALTLGSIMATGCAEHHYRSYDPYYNDYHTWNSGEDVYYRQWINERHYNYVDYNRLEKDRQKEYWEWRH